MFKNCYYNMKKNQINLFQQIKGENFHHIIDWVPYVYIKSTKEDSDAKTIYGDYVKKKIFNTYYEYNDFQKNNKDNVNVYENNVKSEIQFLSEYYHKIPDEEIEVPNLLVYYIDIEVFGENDFPDWKNPKDPIVLISVRNGNTNKTVTFGYDPISNRNYTGNMKNIKYIKCQNEEELLKRFFAYMYKFPCDVFSGFNVLGESTQSGFDIPYIINRSKVLWGEKEGYKMYRRMSPINAVSVWKQKSSDNLNIDIGGLTILDYMDLYKKYGKKLERYSLEYICQKELKKGKLVNSYGSINEQIKRDWNEFVEYNVIDCERVHDLENKLGYIKLVQSLSLLCKCTMKYYGTQTQLIEGLVLTYFRRNELCAPHFYGGQKEPFPAAHVKEPQVGLHEWICDIDISSSYPSHVLALNMSNETFFGSIVNLQEKKIIKYTKKRNFPSFNMIKIIDGKQKTFKFNDEKLKKFNIALERGLFTVAPNGSVFMSNKSKNGIVATIEKNMFFKRKEVKKQKKEFELKANECEGSEKKKYKEKAGKKDSFQTAIKLIMNAFFGIISVPYSRYFNIYFASAITSCGRNTIKKGEIFCNEILNNLNNELKLILNEIDIQENKNIDEKDYIIYIDTDSLFVNLGKFILDNINDKNKWINLSNDKKIKYIKKISKVIEKYIDDRIFNEVQLGEYNSQVKDFSISFKQEIIVKTALFVRKKKYVYWLLDKEGVPKDEIKVAGLELVRSETSEEIRPRLKNIMEMIMKQKSDDEIVSLISKYKKELMKLSAEDLAANIGINGIRKYLGSSGIPKKGTPWHVKGVYGYRLLLKELDIENKYENIKEGLKTKVVYVKKNPYNIETIAFYEWPKEFDNIVQFDKEKMIEKFFIKKIRFLLTPIGKEDILDFDNRGINTFFGV